MRPLRKVGVRRSFRCCFVPRSTPPTLNRLCRLTPGSVTPRGDSLQSAWSRNGNATPQGHETSFLSGLSGEHGSAASLNIRHWEAGKSRTKTRKRNQDQRRVRKRAVSLQTPDCSGSTPSVSPDCAVARTSGPMLPPLNGQRAEACLRSARREPGATSEHRRFSYLPPRRMLCQMRGNGVGFLIIWAIAWWLFFSFVSSVS